MKMLKKGIWKFMKKGIWKFMKKGRLKDVYIKGRRR